MPAILIFFHIWKLFQFKNSPELAFLLLFSLTYPLFWVLALGLNVDIHYFSSNVNDRLITKAFSAQGLFLVCIFLGMRDTTPVLISQYPCRNSSIIFWGCILAMIVSLVVAVSSIDGSIFQQSYDYEESSSSILFEYVLILIIIGYAYSGDKKLRQASLLFMSLMFVITPLYFGKRLPASMVAFAILLLFWRPKNLRAVALIFFIGFFMLSALAIYRVGESGQSMVNVLLNIGDHGAMRNNQGGVIYSSAAYMKLSEQGIFDLIFGLQSVVNTALSIFLPSSMVDKSAYINFAAMSYIPIPGNGGLPGVSFFVWGRVVAVVIMGFFLGWLMKRSRFDYLTSVYVSFLFFTFPRWMAYNVNIMFKAGVLLLVGWILVRLVVYASNRRKHKVSPI
ncbi:hypothetical protein [Marinobacter sp. DSM 26671]|uniref:hypothetical protein n=1 Tax=Marinobacter sp. DSM 26671 TaxID=1761793 RepID=UPI000B8632EA|nr:hypothetical protein [Marinobacter sp. DSM 26671]